MPGEIRQSEIDALLEKVAQRKYGKYLARMTLVRVRSFEGQEISFDFPVTALVGPNGGGKTTVLGAAGLIYRSVQPRRFFAKSGRYDSSMQDWRVEYDLVDRDEQKAGSISRTASYLRAKWNRDAVSRSVLIFGVTRTLPASERKELAKCISGSFSGFGEKSFDPQVVAAVEQILGKEAENYLRVDVDRKGKEAIYAARLPSKKGYSEFHFGAGEASVIRIVSQVEEAPENSLILIEEIENGLHPVATRRLVEYLVKVAQRRSCQVIFTTHSNDAIDVLPSKAVWVAHNGSLTQGKLDVNALRTLTGHVAARLALFVEDDFAKEMVWAALRSKSTENDLDLSGIKIHPLGGSGTVEKVTLAHNANPAISFPAYAILDGDKQGDPAVSTDSHIGYLPGLADPEAHVLDQVAAKIDHVAARLAVMMHLAPTEQGRVKSVVEERRLTNHDRHIIYGQIGVDLYFTAELIVQRAFLAAWAQEYPQEVDAILGYLGADLPKMHDRVGVV